MGLNSDDYNNLNYVQKTNEGKVKMTKEDHEKRIVLECIMEIMEKIKDVNPTTDAYKFLDTLIDKLCLFRVRYYGSD